MIKGILVYLVVAAVCECALSHHLRHHNSNSNSNGNGNGNGSGNGNGNSNSNSNSNSNNNNSNGNNKSSLPDAVQPEEFAKSKSRKSLQPAAFYAKNGAVQIRNDKLPYSYKKLDKMMKKAILQIILGELHPADMLLLKALNYTLEEVMAIREHELSRIKEEERYKARSKKQQEQELLSAKYQAAMRRRSSSRRSKGSRESSREESLEAANRQALLDYENGPSTLKLDYEELADPERPKQDHLDRSMEPHVIFKIRYDDSEFDSSSDERSKTILKSHRSKTIAEIDSRAKSSGADSFQVLAANAVAAAATAATDATDATDAYDLERDNYQVEAAVAATGPSDLDEFNRRAVLDYENIAASTGKRRPSLEYDTDALDDQDLLEMAKKRAREFANHEEFERALNGSQQQRDETATTEAALDVNKEEETTTEPAARKRISEYQGLEWLGDDAYRVIPEAIEGILKDEDEAAAAAAEDYDSRDDDEEDMQQIAIHDLANDTLEYQNDASDASSLYSANDNLTDNHNLTAYQRYTMAQRIDQGQKAIEDIKLRVLAMTGRFNHTSSNNQVQRERLTMFSPICQMPRNTDAEAWSDPFSMNMHFQLNLTSGEHVLAAKLRLFKLPQEVVTSTSSSSSSTYEEEEEDEKKIRVSVYFYTKTLKKHRAKKRLMDSIVTPLTARGSHLALDVRQGLRFWRPNAAAAATAATAAPTGQQQQQHGGHGASSNHGLVVQVEDQDGRPLKPSLYIQEPSCQSANDRSDENQKAYQFTPALFVRACTRYVRIVDGKVEMYVQCRPTQRH